MEMVKSVTKFLLKTGVFLFLGLLLLTVNAIVFMIIDGVTVSTIFFMFLSSVFLFSVAYLLWGKNTKRGWLCFIISLVMYWSFAEFNFDVSTALEIDHCLDLSKTKCPYFWELKLSRG